MSIIEAEEVHPYLSKNGPVRFFKTAVDATYGGFALSLAYQFNETDYEISGCKDDNNLFIQRHHYASPPLVHAPGSSTACTEAAYPPRFPLLRCVL